MPWKIIGVLTHSLSARWECTALGAGVKTFLHSTGKPLRDNAWQRFFYAHGRSKEMRQQADGRPALCLGHKCTKMPWQQSEIWDFRRVPSQYTVLIWRYIMGITTIFLQLAKGMGTTVGIFVLTLLFSLPLGLILSFGRMSKRGVVKGLSKFYISVMRGTPLMLQLIVVYFAPYYVFGIRISSGYRFTAVILAFVLNYAAYFAEIYRSGIESMPAGQYEAAKVLGYSKGQTFFKIILPQVMKRILPPVTNETITLVKDTSLAFVLAEAEMFTIAKQIAAKETSVMPLMAAGVFYYIFNLAVAFGMEYIEKKMNYYR